MREIDGIAATREDMDREILRVMAGQMREYAKLKYIGDCKCGECHLGPIGTITLAARLFERLVEDYDLTPAEGATHDSPLG